MAFLSEVASPTRSARLSWYHECSAWNVQVTCHMIPSHVEISRIESELDTIARSHGGAADGWGCFGIATRSDS